MGRENSIVRLDDGGGDTGSGVDGEFELGFLAIVGGETFKEERAEARASSSAERVEDQETLKGRAVVLLCISIVVRMLDIEPTKTRRILSNVPSKISLPIV